MRTTAAFAGIPLGPCGQGQYHRAVAMLDGHIDEIGEQNILWLIWLKPWHLPSPYKRVHCRYRSLLVSKSFALMEDHGLSQSDLPGRQSGCRRSSLRQARPERPSNARLAARLGSRPRCSYRCLPLRITRHEESKFLLGRSDRPNNKTPCVVGRALRFQPLRIAAPNQLRCGHSPRFYLSPLPFTSNVSHKQLQRRGDAVQAPLRRPFQDDSGARIPLSSPRFVLDTIVSTATSIRRCFRPSISSVTKSPMISARR